MAIAAPPPMAGPASAGPACAGSSCERSQLPRSESSAPKPPPPAGGSSAGPASPPPPPTAAASGTAAGSASASTSSEAFRGSASSSLCESGDPWPESRHESAFSTASNCGFTGTAGTVASPAAPPPPPIAVDWARPTAASFCFFLLSKGETMFAPSVVVFWAPPSNEAAATIIAPAGGCMCPHSFVPALPWSLQPSVTQHPQQMSPQVSSSWGLLATRCTPPNPLSPVGGSWA
mmetsp:Transcript_6629/g.17061  ORF Transcript_6629/g.17061 Transcript_6629/m.17061 type:complete len:233 (+) Transcript_6629:2191-2889(+)